MGPATDPNRATIGLGEGRLGFGGAAAQATAKSSLRARDLPLHAASPSSPSNSGCRGVLARRADSIRRIFSASRQTVKWIGEVQGVFRSLSKKTAWNQLLRRRGCDLRRDYQHRERLLNDDDNTNTPAHFLRILSMAFPLASSSTSLSA
jgi:hypothetical protein